ncbi:MAG: GTP-binding protein [Candidatus Moraniibacteriota bacterium]
MEKPSQSVGEPLFQKIPVVLLSGFLGAGKTTLLNRLLQEEHGQKIAVIVNEFGSIGIDGKLIIGGTEKIVEMNNGCICCTVRTDLVETLTRLAESKLGMSGERLDFESVVIETTGLADPVPLIHTFLLDKVVNTCYELSAIVTLVDASHFTKQRTYLPLVEEQIAFADVVVLNKKDLVSPAELKKLEQDIRTINPFASFCTAKEGNIPFDELFTKKFFDAEKVRSEVEALSHAEHDHLDGIVSVILQTKIPVEEELLYLWLGKMLDRYGPDILRYKGIVSLAPLQEKRVLQGVHALYTLHPGGVWKEGEEKETELVFIGRSLEEEWFKKSFAEDVSPLA